MPKFCTSCGSPVEENLKFCPQCGAQVGAPSAPPPPAPAPAAAPPPSVAPAAAPAAGVAAAGAPAAKAGSPILKIVLIVVGFLVLIGAVGTVTCGYLVYRAKQKLTGMVETAKTMSGKEGTAEISVEKAGEGSEAEAAATADVPPYPGSTATEGGGQFSFGGKGGISSQEYETSDTIEQVLAFYKDKLGSKIRVQESEGKAMFTYTSKNGLTTVTITRDAEAEKTKITIGRIGK
jgi:hypothetical protein